MWRICTDCTVSDLRTVVVWKNIYACIENCMDVCEHAADIVNTVIMKNS